MRNARDIDGNLVNAFGKADRAFEDNVYNTLEGLYSSGSARVKRMSIRLAVTLAAACVMTATVVLAATNSWGMMDFLTKRGPVGAKVSPETVKEIVQTDIDQQGGELVLTDSSPDEAGSAATTGGVSFKVREAVFDGSDVMVIAEAKTTDKNLLLLGVDGDPESPISSLGSAFKDHTGTVGEYAQENGLTMFRVNIADKENMFNAFDFVQEDDGTLVYIMKGMYNEASSKLDLTLRCIVSPVLTEEEHAQRLEEISKLSDWEKKTYELEGVSEAALTFTLERTGQFAPVVLTPAQEYADIGVRVDKITLTGGALSLHVKMECTVTDPAKFAATDDGVFFEFIDENGKSLPPGPYGGGYAGVPDGSGQYVQETSFSAADGMPDKIIVRAYNCWTKNRYETHEFAVK